jgi:hypothetical protein
VQMLQPRIEEARRTLGVAEPALAQETSDDRGDLQGIRQRPSRGVVAG